MSESETPEEKHRKAMAKLRKIARQQGLTIKQNKNSPNLFLVDRDDKLVSPRKGVLPKELSILITLPATDPRVIEIWESHGEEPPE